MANLIGERYLTDVTDMEDSAFSTYCVFDTRGGNLPNVTNYYSFNVAGKTRFAITSTGIKMPAGAAAGYFLTSDANGNGTWVNPASSAGPWTLVGTDLYPDSTGSNVALGAAAVIGGAKLSVKGILNIVDASNAACIEMTNTGGLTLGVTANYGILQIKDNGGGVTISANGGTGLLSAAAASIASTITSAAPATNRLTYSKMTLTPSGTFLAGTNSLAGARGEVNFTAGTLETGFLYGAQGKGIFAGTMLESGTGARLTGVLGQTDVTGATLTTGQVSGVWADLQGNATCTNGETFSLRVTNSMSTDCNALGFFYGKATSFIEVGDAASGFAATASTTTGNVGTAGWLKVIVNGQTRYIPLADSVT